MKLKSNYEKKKNVRCNNNNKETTVRINAPQLVLRQRKHASFESMFVEKREEWEGGGEAA